MKKKIVKSEDYLRVLSRMNEGSVALSIGCGLKGSDIERLELFDDGLVKVYTKERQLNLRVKHHLIEWD